MNGFPKSIDGDYLFPMDDIEKADSGDDSLSTTARGCISETLFKLECMRRGMMPFEPSHPDTKCDAIVQNKKGALVRVQVKRASFQRTVWHVCTCTISGYRPTRNKKGFARIATPYATGDFDFLAAHIPDGDVFCFWTPEFIAGRKGMQWRSGLSPANNWEDLER
jgi:hypothetical protein